MRSHTVAAEGLRRRHQDHDTFDYHFHDTVAGGDWLCEQDVVDHFVHQCPREMTQLEQWAARGAANRTVRSTCGASAA